MSICNTVHLLDLTFVINPMIHSVLDIKMPLGIICSNYLS